MSPARVAIVHEWVDALAGSEQVFAAIARTYPTADLYALSKEPHVNLGLGDRTITTTWLDKPGLRRHRAATLPLMPLAWRTLRAPRYEAVISSHHAFAHVNRLAPVHLCYVHSPARYIWTPEIDSRGMDPVLCFPRMLLKRVDRNAARRVTSYAANSTAVARRIERFWDRDSIVIPPPVRVGFFSGGGADAQSEPSRNYILGVGRWIPYKNLHLVIQVGSEVGLPVKIAGSGPEGPRLRAAAEAARVPVEFIESPGDLQLRELYRNAAVLVFPTYEDFGIVPVEAQAAGTPVVAPRFGGTADSVIDGCTGVLVSEIKLPELSRAVGSAVGLSSIDCLNSATRFNELEFVNRLQKWSESFGVQN